MATLTVLTQLVHLAVHVSLVIVEQMEPLAQVGVLHNCSTVKSTAISTLVDIYFMDLLMFRGSEYMVLQPREQSGFGEASLRYLIFTRCTCILHVI